MLCSDIVAMVNKKFCRSAHRPFCLIFRKKRNPRANPAYSRSVKKGQPFERGLAPGTQALRRPLPSGRSITHVCMRVKSATRISHRQYTQRASSGPTNRRAEGRALVWGSEFTTKADIPHGDSKRVIA